ncbi:epi-cedrol synthase [Tanacetum coccineum]
MSLIVEDVIRPNANFPSEIWGDQFLAHDQDEQEGVDQVIEDLKEEVRREILRALNIPTQHVELLKFIDAIERLGIAHFFEEEINQVFQYIYTAYGDKWTGGNTSLWFRLMRQHGFFVSSG